MSKNDNACPYCGDEMWSVAAYEHHVKTEHVEVAPRGHICKFTIPLEWDTVQVVGGNSRIASTSVTILMCACGAEKERE